jgi:hypothetical protein
LAAGFDGLPEHAIYPRGSPGPIFNTKQNFIDRDAPMEHIYSEGFIHLCARPVPA